MKSAGLVGRKLGMLSVYDSARNAVAVTAIEALPCIVTQVKTVERDGYRAIQVGYGKSSKVNNPIAGHLGDSGAKTRNFAEFSVEDGDESDLNVGDKIDCSIFNDVKTVKITGYSKGRGFAGGVRRYNFKGGPKTHGQSDRHRAPGSAGAGSSPGRTLPGTRMAGHYGNERFTIKGLRLFRVEADDNLILVKGAAPGRKNGIVLIQKQTEAAS